MIPNIPGQSIFNNNLQHLALLHVLSILQALTRDWGCFRALWSHPGPAERQGLSSLSCAPAHLWLFSCPLSHLMVSLSKLCLLCRPALQQLLAWGPWLLHQQIQQTIIVARQGTGSISQMRQLAQKEWLTGELGTQFPAPVFSSRPYSDISREQLRLQHVQRGWEAKRHPYPLYSQKCSLVCIWPTQKWETQKHTENTARSASPPGLASAGFITVAFAITYRHCQALTWGWELQ